MNEIVSAISSVLILRIKGFLSLYSIEFVTTTPGV